MRLVVVLVKSLFEDKQTDRLSSAEIVADLEGREDRPWPEFYQGKAITLRGVARLLEPFKIKPRQIRMRHMQVQGYLLVQFKGAFKDT